MQSISTLSGSKTYFWHDPCKEYLWRLEARVWSGKRDGWGCLFGVELAGGGEAVVVVVSTRQGVCWRQHKNWRLQAWPRLFPTRSTFFSAGMRHRHLLQAETYNLGLSGPLSHRINWCAGPFSTVPTGSRIPAHAFLRHIPVPGGVSPVFYGSSAQGWGEG